MKIPDEAVEAAAEAIWNNRPASRTRDGSPTPWATLKDYQTERHRESARAALSAALPAIERAHLEQLADEAHAEWQEQAPHFPSAGLPYRWLRARLDQTKEKP